MPTARSELDPAFIEQQRQSLLRLRAGLIEAAQDAETEETGVNEQSDAGPVEFEDDAQRLDTLEREGNLVAREVDRLQRIDRALEKIKDGTYGLSDVSGEPIPRERLEAVPDAVDTVDEEADREKRR
ncbi:MAG: TraR/DksA family transcriptional regulator [Sinobacteraceae bacterium]|nr:TraR/DksA family transcriptional regulator [Nevskiaceae bacterium]